jgi:hypothetical protein
MEFVANLNLNTADVPELATPHSQPIITRIGGFGVSTTGDLLESAEPPALKTGVRLPAPIKSSDTLVEDVIYDFAEYAAAAADLPAEAFVSKRNCVRKLLRVFIRDKADPFTLSIIKRDGLIILDREEREAEPEGYGGPFERLMTTPKIKRDKMRSFHSIIHHDKFVGSSPLIVCCEVDARDSDTGVDVELTSKVNKPSKKMGRLFPMNKQSLSIDPYHQPRFRDQWGQMYFGNIGMMKMGIIENDHVSRFAEWSLRELRDIAFGASTNPMGYIRKVAGVLSWIRNSVAQEQNCLAALSYEDGEFTLQIDRFMPEDGAAAENDEILDAMSNLRVNAAT